jgi:hypothetical protein
MGLNLGTQMSEAINEAELGRGKKSFTPAQHLEHLLGLGWDAKAPLIANYVLKNRLERQLAEWQATHPDSSEQGSQGKLKNRKGANR